MKLSFSPVKKKQKANKEQSFQERLKALKEKHRLSQVVEFNEQVMHTSGVLLALSVLF